MKLAIILSTCFFTLISCGVSSSEHSKSVPKNSLYDAELVNYVNEIDYSEPSLVHNDSALSLKTIQLIELLFQSDTTSIDKSLNIFFNGIKRDEQALNIVDSVFYLYLNDPNSPVRNDELYIKVLENLLASNPINEAVKLRADDSLKRLNVNRPGRMASNFKYINRLGIVKNLYEPTSKLTLLVFYDPECSHCGEILKSLSTEEIINTEIRNNQLDVVAIYAEGKRKIWEETKGNMPQNWEVGYDLAGVLDHDLYDLPAMPTIFLLDQEKKVILKDPSLQVLYSFLD